MNKVILMGRLTKDPEIRYTNVNNTMVATFSLAVNRRFWKEGQADFIQIVVWDKKAEFVQKYFTKGMQVAVVGSIQTRAYDDKDGKRVYVTEVIAEEVYFAESRKAEASEPAEENPFLPPYEYGQVTDDDLPF